MNHKIKKLYVVHHSHTDIGYTDLQERVINFQVNHIHSLLDIFSNEQNQEFRWNCETFFCVEQFLQSAESEQKEIFFNLIKSGKIGLSAIYLNFTDLLDSSIFEQRLYAFKQMLAKQNIDLKTAMFADINGISMGQRDALINNGIEFLYTNIHTHHGMYPLYRNQNAFWWENKNGKKILVWNGEHYNLGNALGLKSGNVIYYMSKSYFGQNQPDEELERLHSNLEHYLTECEDSGYPYDFIISSVSGVFSDNAPPNLDILNTIKQYNQKYSNELQIKMVTLDELYNSIYSELKDIPTYHGDLNDWWANGAGSTPYVVKHYKAAQRTYHLAGRIDKSVYENYPNETKIAQDNLLLYAEHTWGHSASITDPYSTMVSDLNIRKNSYASKAHEFSTILYEHALKSIGKPQNYYNRNGKIRVVNPSNTASKMQVQFYIETIGLKGAKVINAANSEKMTVQVSPHPRGAMISFVDYFEPKAVKEYIFEEIQPKENTVNTRYAYIGAERVQDIINDYDNKTYKLPYSLENKWFLIQYEIGKGITSFKNKIDGTEMLCEGLSSFFTPIYECTQNRKGDYTERQLLGRNIRGIHAQQFQAKLIDIKFIENGEVFTIVELIFELKGTRHCAMNLKIYNDIPRIDFTLRIAKEISNDVESLYLPLQLSVPNSEIYLKKGAEAFRPGVDQIPGTNMEYYMSDLGIVYKSTKQNILIYTLDTPLVYMGEMKHHPIQLCDNRVENNNRNIYSWIMNNTWETNFNIDLSGYGEFCYRLELSDKSTVEECFDEMVDKSLGTVNITIE